MASSKAVGAERRGDVDPLNIAGGGNPRDVLASTKHAPAAQGPASAEAMAEADEILLDEIYHDLWLIRSYTTSALEACQRGDRRELRLRLRGQLRDLFRHAVDIHKLLSSESGK